MLHTGKEIKGLDGKLKVKARVVAHSLVGAANLNGLQGVITSFLDDSPDGRAAVDFGGEAGKKSIRRQNLENLSQAYVAEDGSVDVVLEGIVEGKSCEKCGLDLGSTPGHPHVSTKDGGSLYPSKQTWGIQG